MNRLFYFLIGTTALVDSFFFGYYLYKINHEDDRKVVNGKVFKVGDFVQGEKIDTSAGNNWVWYDTVPHQRYFFVAYSATHQSIIVHGSYYHYNPHMPSEQELAQIAFENVKCSLPKSGFSVSDVVINGFHEFKDSAECKLFRGTLPDSPLSRCK